MSRVFFLRRKSLGAGSIKGMLAYMHNRDDDPSGAQPADVSVLRWQGLKGGVWRNDKAELELGPDDVLMRWGCTSRTSVPLSQQLNKSEGIKTVADKRGFRMLLQEVEDGVVPRTWTEDSAPSITFPAVVRPTHHHQGRHLVVVNNYQELVSTINRTPFRNGWYVSELIDKAAEYRVCVAQGRVSWVARKTPGDPSMVAWNVAQGGRFDNVRWDHWFGISNVIKAALKAFPHTKLDLTGIDVMVDQDNRAYVIEANSAPTQPLFSDGSVSYRQRCTAKALMYAARNREHMSPDHSGTYWRTVIHPAVGG